MAARRRCFAPFPALTGSLCAVVQAVCGAQPAKATGSAARAVSGRKAVAGAALKVAVPVRKRLQGRPLVLALGLAHAPPPQRAAARGRVVTSAKVGDSLEEFLVAVRWTARLGPAVRRVSMVRCS
jgi:hypothetical protein